MKSIVVGVAIALAAAAVAPAASAQATAAAALPPGGQTIGGPGLLATSPSRTIWTAHTPLNICVTVVGAAGTASTIGLKLLPTNTTQAVQVQTQGVTLCGDAETSVTLSNSLGTVFWRVDRTN